MNEALPEPCDNATSNCGRFVYTADQMHAHAFKRVRDDGAAEASLIALYGLNQGKQ